MAELAIHLVIVCLGVLELLFLRSKSLCKFFKLVFETQRLVAEFCGMGKRVKANTFDGRYPL